MLVRVRLSWCHFSRKLLCKVLILYFICFSFSMIEEVLAQLLDMLRRGSSFWAPYRRPHRLPRRLQEMILYKTGRKKWGKKRPDMESPYTQRSEKRNRSDYIAGAEWENRQEAQQRLSVRGLKINRMLLDTKFWHENQDWHEGALLLCCFPCMLLFVTTSFPKECNIYYMVIYK